jgi:hypothetical protein
MLHARERKETRTSAAFLAERISAYRLTPCENQMRHEAASSGHRIFLVAIKLASNPSKEAYFPVLIEGKVVQFPFPSPPVAAL